MAIPYSKSQQLARPYKKPSRAKQAIFTHGTRQMIIERDSGYCVRCGRPYAQIHHIELRSRGGSGHHTNGCCVCVDCHIFAHSGAEGEAWFRDFKERMRQS